MNFSTLNYKTDEQISEFLSTQSIQNLVHALNINYTETVYEKIINMIFINWFSIHKIDFENHSIKVLKILYELNMHKFHKDGILNEKLENNLNRGFISYFSKNTNNNDELFLELFMMMHFECISYEQLKKIANLEQCKRLRKINVEVSERILHGFENNNTSDDIHEIKFEPKIDAVHFSLLGIGEKYDIKDRYNVWYVGSVLDIVDNTVYVSFDGFSQSNNERITWTECLSNPRISRHGSMTNKVSHTGDYFYCLCWQCTSFARNNMLNNNIKQSQISKNQQLTIGSYVNNLYDHFKTWIMCYEL